MNENLRVMSEKPLNAETPAAHLQSWITANDVFFKRNQGQIMSSPVAIDSWRLSIEGLVNHPIELNFADILAMPKLEVADTLECSGNGRSLLAEKASGNPWTIGGVGNAIWGGVRLAAVLETAGVAAEARHVSFEGLDQPLGSAGIKFIRSIPLAKALDSTILAYEMNGEPLPVAHGYPLRALALGWTGANCVKWLSRITLLDKPFEGFFMDKVYRVFQKGEDPATGEVVTTLPLKSIITWPENGATLARGPVAIRGAAYAGETEVARVEVSVDDGATWQAAEFIGPHAPPFAWRRWEYLWPAPEPGAYTLLARATDSHGRVQPASARWNVLGYGNNGIREHAVAVIVR
jgi:DMSO/TMAO reductase YedYZ molybdopterin-dependent catalytic subunit